MRFKRPSGATVIAFVALFTVLGGSAYAAKKITSADIQNGTIKATDLSRSAKKALRGNRGPAGPQGLPGPQGIPGPQGPAGPSGVTEIVSAQGEGVGLAMAVCPPGTRPVSGGGLEEGTGYLWASGAAKNDSTGQIGWLVAGNPTSPVTAFAYCSSGVARFTFPDGSSAQMLKVSQVKAAARRRAAR